MHRIAEYLGRRLDLLCGIAGCLTGAVIVVIGYITGAQATAEMGVALSVACVIYLLFRKKIADSSRPSIPSRTSLTLVLNIIFISAFAASIFVVHLSLHRPPLYFLLISISVAAVAAETLSSESKTQTWLLLLKILLISLNLRAGLFYAFPWLTGTDAWHHISIIETWIDGAYIGNIISPTSFVTYTTTYVDFPVMHLIAMATKIITALNSKDSLFLSIGIFNVISTMFIFLIGQRLLDEKCGLLAALFISLSPPNVSFGAVLIPNSLGVVIFSMIFFLVFKSISTATNSLLIILLSVTLILTHTISAFVTSIMLLIILIVNGVYKKIDSSNKERLSIGYNMVTLFEVLLITRWIYCFYGPGGSFLQTMLIWFVDALRMDTELVGTVIPIEAPSPLNRIWFLMFIGFSVIGALFWLSREMRSNSRIAVIVCLFGLAMGSIIFPILNIWNLLPGRWVAFVMVSGAVLMILGILLVSEVVNGKIKKAVLVVIIVFVFSMFSINSGPINWQTPFYKEHSRSAFTQSELSATDTLSRTYGGNIITDYDYSELAFMYNKLVLGGQPEFTELTHLNPEVESDGLVVLRDYLYTHPEILRSGVELESDFFSKFNSSGYDKIYDNGEVRAHLSK